MRGELLRMMGQLRSRGANVKRIALCAYGGIGTNDAYCFVCDGKPRWDYFGHYSWE